MSGSTIKLKSAAQSLIIGILESCPDQLRTASSILLNGELSEKTEQTGSAFCISCPAQPRLTSIIRIYNGTCQVLVTIAGMTNLG